jgi:hypothetical protein
MSFRNLTPEQRSAAAAVGGRAAQAKPNAHRWTPEQARIAGQKGGDSYKRNMAARKAAREAAKVTQDEPNAAE